MYSCMNIYIYTYTYTYTYMYTWIHINIRTHIYVHIHIHIHIYAYAHIYICKYIYIYRICTSYSEREATVYTDVHNICLTYTPAHAWCSTTPDLIYCAFITVNSGLEPLLKGLFAQIHVNLSWRVFGRNRTGDLRITKFVESRALHHWANMTDGSQKIPQDPPILWMHADSLQKCIWTRAWSPIQRCSSFLTMEAIANLSWVLREHRTGCRLPLALLPPALLPAMCQLTLFAKSVGAGPRWCRSVHHLIIHVGAGHTRAEPRGAFHQKFYFHHFLARVLKMHRTSLNSDSQIPPCSLRRFWPGHIMIEKSFSVMLKTFQAWCVKDISSMTRMYTYKRVLRDFRWFIRHISCLVKSAGLKKI